VKTNVFKKKFKKNIVNFASLKKVVISYFFGMFWNGSNVWLNEITTLRKKDKLSSFQSFEDLSERLENLLQEQLLLSG